MIARLKSIFNEAIKYTRIGGNPAGDFFNAAWNNDKDKMRALVKKYPASYLKPVNIFTTACIHDVENIKIFFDMGEEIKQKLARLQGTAFCIASARDNTDIIEYLQSQEFDIDAPCEVSGHTALMSAKTSVTAQWIINNGADVNRAHPKLGNALTCAVKHLYEEFTDRHEALKLIQTLVDNKANPNQLYGIDSHTVVGDRPRSCILMIPLLQGDAETFAMLVEAGAKLEIGNINVKKMARDAVEASFRNLQDNAAKVPGQLKIIEYIDHLEKEALGKQVVQAVISGTRRDVTQPKKITFK